MTERGGAAIRCDDLFDALSLNARHEMPSTSLRVTTNEVDLCRIGCIYLLMRA